MWSPKYCNCWIWAIVQRLRSGGKVCVGKSEYVPLIPHVQWLDREGHLWEYVPMAPKVKCRTLRDVWRLRPHFIMFRGVIRYVGAICHDPCGQRYERGA